MQKKPKVQCRDKIGSNFIKDRLKCTWTLSSESYTEKLFNLNCLRFHFASVR